MHLPYNNFLNGFFFDTPVDTATGELSVDDIADLLKDDEEPAKDKEPEEKEPEEKIELSEEEEQPTEEDEEVDLTTPVRKKEILKKYPELFKDFPYLEKAYFREQQFTEILGTVDDARAAVEKAQALDQYESELIDGNTEGILKSVKDGNKEAFAKIVDDYLPALARVDRDAYFHVLANVTKNTIVTMLREGKANQDTDLEAAARILNKFVFGTAEFTPPTNLSQPKEDNKLETERAQFLQERFETARDDLDTRIENVLKSTINEHIDPKESMTEYVKKNAVREAFENIDNLLAQDDGFRKILDKLWEKARDDKFSRTSVDKIRAAYLSKAKTLLPSVIQKARNNALRGLGKRVVDDTKDKRGPLRPSAPSSGKSKDGKIPAGMTTLEFLNQD